MNATVTNHSLLISARESLQSRGHPADDWGDARVLALARVWTAEELASALLPDGWTGTALDLLASEEVEASDRLGLVLRNDVLDERSLSLFALWCARSVEHLATDSRVKQCDDVTDRFLRGDATREELEAAREAAREAGAAAWEAAWADREAAWADREAAGAAWAAWAAAWAAREAAWEAAWAAWEAAGADREAGAAAWEAAVAEQILALVEILTRVEK